MEGVYLVDTVRIFSPFQPTGTVRAARTAPSEKWRKVRRFAAGAPSL
jgi:hypothetical protein